MLRKIILFFIFLNLFISDSFSTDLDKNIPKNVIETTDLGLYIYIKVIDENNKPLSNVKVKSSNSETITDKNGEFILNVNENDTIFFYLDGYKEEYIKVSDIKGKIKLYKEPDILLIYPNFTFDVNYKNVYLNEKYQDILSQGNINNSFEITSSLKLFNNLLLNLSYDNLIGKIKKPEITNEFHSHNVNFKANYIHKIIENRIELLFGINSFFNAININSNDSDDYLDFNHSKLGIGLNLSSGIRPIKYFPLVINAFISYSPFVIVNDANNFLPNTLQSLDLGINSRYDWNNIYLKLAYIYSNIYGNSFYSLQSIIKTGIGYAF
ncbi:MAG: hypothetical protein KatS3mg068_1697 [Candidatus Sericytochromatia bacterium]|nr:MAG: hypothetical protein KatS3mg068_1697 [Candidatus Sericytochromatia bacterium]